MAPHPGLRRSRRSAPGTVAPATRTVIIPALPEGDQLKTSLAALSTLGAGGIALMLLALAPATAGNGPTPRDEPTSLAEARAQMRRLVPDIATFTPGNRSHYGHVPYAQEHPDPLQVCGQVPVSTGGVKRRRCVSANDLSPESRQALIELQGALIATGQRKTTSQ